MRALAHHKHRSLISLFQPNRSLSLNIDASRISREIPNDNGRVYHNHDGPTYSVSFNDVAPHILMLGANANPSEQPVLKHISPQPPQAWNRDFEHITPQPSEASGKDLCHVASIRKANSKRSFTFIITHPEIWRSLASLLDSTNPSHL